MTRNRYPAAPSRSGERVSDERAFCPCGYPLVRIKTGGVRCSWCGASTKQGEHVLPPYSEPVTQR